MHAHKHLVHANTTSHGHIALLTVPYPSACSGFALMGFKPRSRLKKHSYIKPSSFIYPDESVSSYTPRTWKRDCGQNQYLE